MRIQCDRCSQALDLPADKIPNHRFSVACPACQHKILVDPAQGAVQSPPAGPAAASPEAAAPVPAPAPPAAGPANMADTGELPTLRGLDRELIEAAVESAVIAHQGVDVDPRLEAELRRLDFREVHHAAGLEAACEQVQEGDVDLLLIRMPSVPAPPCPPLAPLYKLPVDLRRRTFTALVADNVKTLDGQVAFYLQVNCLIQSAEPHLAVKLRRALLHDLRLYRHWHGDE